MIGFRFMLGSIRPAHENWVQPAINSPLATWKLWVEYLQVVDEAPEMVQVIDWSVALLR
jgi:hypothetical protein